jgi:ABC-type uncharacterized transport system permease subunit
MKLARAIALLCIIVVRFAIDFLLKMTDFYRPL